METKEEKIAAARIVLKGLGLTIQDLLEDNSQLEEHHFLDIKKINNVPCMYIGRNNKTDKNEWFCLESPGIPMNWDEGREWCKFKGGDYGKLSTSDFISRQRVRMNKVLEANGYPLIEEIRYWSIGDDNYTSWVLYMADGRSDAGNKYDTAYIMAVITTD